MKRKNVPYLLAVGVAAGLLSGSTTCEGEGNIPEEDNSTFIEQDISNEARIKQKEEIGKQIIDILRESGEFDKVDYELRGFDLNDSEKDLIIKSYRKEGEVFWLEWGLNLDHICPVYPKEDMPVPNRPCVETLEGAIVCSPSFEQDTAKKLVEIINDYVKNDGRCNERNIFY